MPSIPAPYVSKDEVDKNAIPGSVLLPTAGRNRADGTPLIALNTNSTIEGFIIHYPDWKYRKISEPCPYPPCIAATGTNNAVVKRMNILDAYHAIRMQWSARFLVSDVHGHPSHMGISVDCSCDTSRIENVHWTRQGSASDAYCRYHSARGTAFEFRRDDFQNVQHSSCYSYAVGFRFDKTALVPEKDEKGTPIVTPRECNAGFVGCSAIRCENAIVADYVQLPGLMFTKCKFVGRLSFDNCTFQHSRAGNTILMRARGATLDLQNCDIEIGDPRTASNGRQNDPCARCAWVRVPDPH